MKVDVDGTCALALVCGRVSHLLEPWGNLWDLSDTTCRVQPWKNVVPELWYIWLEAACLNGR